MLRSKNVTLGALTQTRTAVALFAATLLFGGSISEASAKSRHHRHQAAKTTSSSAQNTTWNSWRDANAAVTPSKGSGRSFSGMASFYGNESGSKTASGQRFNQSAMTAAHRSLPFGTKLKVTHGDRSVVVTINDRGPFIKGRVLDLSKGAAAAVGLTSAKGVGRVVAEVQ